MLAGFPAREATGTSLAAIVITATVGATLYAIEGEVGLAPGRACRHSRRSAASSLGTALQQRIPARNLTFAFAAAARRARALDVARRRRRGCGRLERDTRTILAALAAGVAAGILAGLFGVGGGLLFVPALAALGLSQLSAEATSLVAVIPTVAVGAYRRRRPRSTGPPASSASHPSSACSPASSSPSQPTSPGPPQALRRAPPRDRRAARLEVCEGTEESLMQPPRMRHSVRAERIGEGSMSR